MVVKPGEEDMLGGGDWEFGRAFIKQHQQEFGFILPNRDIMVDDVRIRGIGKSFTGFQKTVDQQLKDVKISEVTPGTREYKRLPVYFEGGRQQTPIYRLDELKVGDKINGPVILADGTQTVVVTPGASAVVLETHVIINIGERESSESQVLG